MQVAITADVHLTDRARHPERYQVLEAILHDVCERGIPHLVIAGDLFDASQRNYAEFESLCTRPEFSNLQLTIIRGNHDVDLRNMHIASENIHVIDEPKLHYFSEGTRPFLFIPYDNATSMGEAIAPFKSELTPNDWILVGHGDWISGNHAPNPYEPGVYMPLTRADVQRFQPSHVFLGHIHVPVTREPIFYCGSPCGLDITETGQRRFLIYDLTTAEATSQQCNAPVLYFDEQFVIVPAADESALIHRQIEERIHKWQLTPRDEKKARIRIRVRGYSADKQALATVVRQAFSGYVHYQNAEPDLSDVFIADDIERATITNQVLSQVEDLDWPSHPDEPTKDDIILDALHVIYGS